MVATMHNVGASSTYCVHCRGSRRQCLSDHWQSRPTRCQRLHPAQQDAERCSGSWETPAPHRPALGCVRVESALLTPGAVQVADGCRVTDSGCVELPTTRDPSTACHCTPRASAARAYPIGQGAGRGEEVRETARRQSLSGQTRPESAARCRKRCQRSACTRVLKGAGRCSGWPQTPAHCWVAGHSLLRLATLARVSTALRVEHGPQQPALFELPAACGMPRQNRWHGAPQSAFATCPVAGTSHGRDESVTVDAGSRRQRRKLAR